MMPYKAPPIRLDEIPKKENTKPELVCKEKMYFEKSSATYSDKRQP